MPTAHSPLSTKSIITTIAVTVMTVSLLVVHSPRVAAQVTDPTQPVETAAPELSSQQRIELTAIPPRLGEDNSLKAVPGQTVQTAVRIRNVSDVPQSIETIVEDFIIGADGEQPIPVTEETPSQWSLASWVTLSPSFQVIQPNETATVNVLIEVPADANPGGRYAMIMHQPTGASSASGVASGVSQRVGTLLYFRVEGDINEEAYITDVKVPSWSEFGPIPFSLAIDNRSDIHIQPKVMIEIKNMLGRPSGEIELETKNIFPYTTRGFETNWEKIWGLGRYSATITASYGTTGKIAQQVVSFWIIPVKLLLALAVGISSLAVMAILIRRHLIHRSDFKSQQIQMLEDKLKKLESSQEQRFKDENH